MIRQQQKQQFPSGLIREGYEDLSVPNGSPALIDEMRRLPLNEGSSAKSQTERSLSPQQEAATSEKHQGFKTWLRSRRFRVGVVAAFVVLSHQCHVQLQSNTAVPYKQAHTQVDQTISMHRTAYLITVNTTSPRTLRSIGILESVGFDVKLEIAPVFEDKVVSNKMAQINIYKQIAKGKDGWGYIFEDDIILVGKSKEKFYQNVDFSVPENLLGLESEKCLGIYLGICAPARPRSAQPEHTNRYCGRCAHAYGVSREGAKALLDYHEERQAEPYMDMIIEELCKKVGGFPVSHREKESDQLRLHYGTFIQDRRTFKTMIG